MQGIASITCVNRQVRISLITASESKSCSFCKRGSSSPAFSSVRVLFWFRWAVLPTLGVRFGEALHPGPVQFTLSVRNVVSASKHMEELLNSSDAIMWSETSATSSTQKAIKYLAKKHHGFCSFSAPTQPRTVCGNMTTGRGEAAGTLLYSRRHKQLSLEGSWDPVIWATGRVCDCLVSVGVSQIRFIGAYGYHSSLPNAEARNEILFDAVAEQACSFPVPTVVCGDFNSGIEELSMWSSLQTKGFIDVGHHFAALSGKEPECTYRGISRLDYCICNAQAWQFVKGYVVHPRGYTDHAELEVVLHFPQDSPQTMTWAMPRDLQSVPGTLKAIATAEVSTSQQESFFAAVHQEDTTQQFDIFANTFETIARQASVDVLGKALSGVYLGRGKGKLRVARQTKLSALRDGACVTDRVIVSRRHKVVNVLLELAHHVCDAKRPVSAAQHNAWKRLHNMPGFPRGFPAWLLENEIVDYVPCEFPAPAWFSVVRDAVLVEVKWWDSVVSKQKAHLWSQQMTEDWKSGGKLHARQLKPDQAPIVHTLVDEETVHVKSMRAKKGSNAKFLLVHGRSPSPGTVWSFENTKCRILAVDKQVVTLDTPLQSCMQKRVVRQKMWNANPLAVGHTITKYWESFWLTEQRPDLQIAHRLAQQLPQLPVFDPTITLGELEWALKTSKNGKARGLDGFSFPELKALPPKMVEMLLHMLNSITSTGKWPQPLLDAAVTLLGKCLQPESPADARPITVLASIYRVWARCQAAKVYAAILPHLPSALCGSVPGKSAMDLAWILQNEIEFSLLSGEPLVGFALDLSKAYNTISRPVLDLAAERLGWPVALRNAYAAFLKGVRRHFRVGEHVSAPVLSHTGVPEGCPLAVVSMIAITWLVSAEVESKHSVPMKSYVDNWTVQSGSGVCATEAVACIASTTSQLAMTVSLTKSFAYATTKEGRSFLRRTVLEGVSIPVVHDFTDLGVVFSARARGCAKGFQHRLEKNAGKFQKLQLVKWSADRKVTALKRVILPATLYGCEMASISDSSFKCLRGKSNKAVWGEHSQRNHYLAPLVAGSHIYEPWLIVFKKRWQTLRRIWVSVPDFAAKWNYFAGVSVSKGMGPLSLFLLDLRFLGWEPQAHGRVALPEGDTLHVYFSNWSLVWGKLLKAWETHVCTQVQSCKGLLGLQGFFCCPCAVPVGD